MAYEAPISVNVAAPLLSTLFSRNEDTKEATILNGVGELCQMSFNYILAPFGRHLDIYSTIREINAASSVLKPADIEGHWSKSYIQYQNGIIYFEKEEFQPQAFEDLTQKRVVSFPGATEFLSGLKEVKNTFASYSEPANQYTHVQLLFAGRVDAIIAEKYITLMNAINLTREDARKIDKMVSLRFYPFYQASPAHMVFKDVNLQQRFDACLDKPEAKALIKETEDMFNQDYPNYVVSPALSSGGKP